ncbi:DMT family transporter [Bordetella hinzii]|uniref:EamA family transporter n=2 Tax=Bordetella hinzii TaxID=103855 RepID=A0AAN1RZW7_9BORD|nr:EamA family transporter [Bordetella hinzii]KCB47640.1 EamA-like transporter family protein [Bordetella hinzii 4161]KXA73569.1 transporter [Bordetella hinzii LMG 13501]MBZ0073504.1 DMT family transporter [Bordetella hinzii]MBZ0078020.1 DMT family transporter [Bordetella hinzii]
MDASAYPAATMSRRHALILLVLVAICWGLNWPFGKMLLEDLPPLWIVLLRSALGTVALFMLCLARRRLVWPRRGDWPVIASVGVLHMTAFSALVSVGLNHVSAGRSVLLAYTTPLWVLPLAAVVLRERPARGQWLGAALALTGLLVLFQPAGFDWRDSAAWRGNVLILLGAMCWAGSIVYIRAHRWLTPPFELTFWQALLATLLLLPLTLALEGPPRFSLGARDFGLLLYGGVFAIAVAYWALTTVNRAIPSGLTSLGLLLVPVVGILSSRMLLGEQPGLELAIAALCIISGVVTSLWARPSGRG